MPDSTKKNQTEITIQGLPSGLDNETLIVAGHCANLLETLLDKDVEISTSCGGQGTCGTCRVFIIQGEQNLNPRTEIEIEMAQDRGFLPNERLSCQCEVRGALRIEIPNKV